MEVTIIYFSQTGNTYKVAEALSDTFREDQHHVQMIPLCDASVEDFADTDLLGVGTPCFSSRAPLPVMRLLNSLPLMEKRQAFVFATCGGAPGRVLFDMEKALRKKGFNVLAGHLSRGEVKHPAPTLNGRFPGCPNSEDLAYARYFAKAVGAFTSAKSPTSLSRSFICSTRLGWGFYDFLGSAISDPFLRLFMPEPKLDECKCDQCGVCILECPTQNISLETFPALGDECIRCYHCYNRCPSDAYTTNWLFGNFILWLLYNQHFVRWFGRLKTGEQMTDIAINNSFGV